MDNVQSSSSLDPSSSNSASITSQFDDWIMENGGGVELLDVLKKNGFSSKLSLRKMDFDCPESQEMLKALPYGKRCLLKALLEDLLKEDVESPQPVIGTGSGRYSTGATRAASLVVSGNSTSNLQTNIKDKIGKLFHFHTASSSSSACKPTVANDDDDFEPIPTFR